MLLDLELARRIELAEAEAAVAGAEAMRDVEHLANAAVERIAGGFAVYCGPGSPVTQAVALGLDGPLSKEEFDRLEEFYFEKGEAVRVETCPMADATLFALYGERGYRVTEFSNVMARPVEVDERWVDPAEIEVRLAGRDEIDLWTLAVAQSFAEYFPVTQELLSVMKMFALGKNMECYLARIGGKVAGGGALSLRGKTAGFFGAGTLMDFRKRGVQTALLHERMRRAAELGCDLAVSLALPGSESQRNITRLGFRTLYTRVKFERGWKEEGDKTRNET